MEDIWDFEDGDIGLFTNPISNTKSYCIYKGNIWYEIKNGLELYHGYQDNKLFDYCFNEQELTMIDLPKQKG